MSAVTKSVGRAMKAISSRCGWVSYGTKPRLLRVVTSGACIIGLVLATGCGSDEQDDGGGSAATQESKEITFIGAGKGDEFFITIGCGAQAEAERLGVKLDIQQPDKGGDPSLQIPIINAVSAKKPDAIIFAPTDPQAVYGAIKGAADQGAKVVLVDNPTVPDADFAASVIATDNLAGGREGAKEMARLVGGEGKVFTVGLRPGIVTTDARQKGFEEGIKEVSGIEYVGAQYNDFETSKAASVVSATLQKEPDLAGVFATDTFGGEGAATAVRQADKVGDVKIVAFDASPAEQKALEDGVIQALVAQSAFEIGRLAIQQAVAAIDGEPGKAKIDLPPVVATMENKSEERIARNLYRAEC